MGVSTPPEMAEDAAPTRGQEMLLPGGMFGFFFMPISSDIG